jgi:hypothetical protein
MPPTVKCVAVTFTTVPPWLVGSFRRMTLGMILSRMDVTSVTWPDPLKGKIEKTSAQLRPPD